jgi:hypothetical protein
LENYIFPPNARRKLKIAKEVPQTAYIFGSADYGKTEPVKQFLGKRRHVYLSRAVMAHALLCRNARRNPGILINAGIFYAFI